MTYKLTYPGSPVVESLPSLDKTAHYLPVRGTCPRECPRCGGALFQEREVVGLDILWTVSCLVCGWREWL